MLLATIADILQNILWSKTKDAQHGRNKPKSLLESITHPQNSDKYMKFSSIEEFEKMRQKIIGDNNG